MTLVVRNLHKKITADPKTIRKIALGILPQKEKRLIKEITVLIVGDDAMKELNLNYCADPGTTDVLSFSNSLNNKQMLLDIAISADTAIRQAKIYKTTPLYEIYLYAAHGVLHSIGYNDDTQRKQELMQKKAESILKGALPKHVYPSN